MRHVMGNPVICVVPVVILRILAPRRVAGAEMRSRERENQEKESSFQFHGSIAAESPAKIKANVGRLPRAYCTVRVKSFPSPPV